MALKIIFAGTPPISAKLLIDLLAKKYHIIACYTQPDRPKGRQRTIEPSAVKQIATQHNIIVKQPKNFKVPGAIEELQQLNPDIMLVFAYGLILPKEVIAIPRLGCINVHTSLLPRWRGAAPVQHAIMAGDDITGISIMQIDPGLDTGNILNTMQCSISRNETSASLFAKLQPLATTATIITLEQLVNATAKSVAQNHALATYAYKIDKTMAKINWRLSSIQIDRLIRAFIPQPVAYTCFSETELTQELTNNPEQSSKRLLKFVQNLSINNEICIKILQAAVINTKLSEYKFNLEAEKDLDYHGKIIAINPCGLDVLTGDSCSRQNQDNSNILRIEKLQLPGSKILAITDILNTPKYKFLFSLGRKFI